MKSIGTANIPELLRMKNGQLCDSAETWEKTRRKEILDIVTKNLYGRYPGKPDKIDYTVMQYNGEALGGIATQEIVEAKCYGPEGVFSFRMNVHKPKNLDRYGAIVHIEGQPITDEIKKMHPPDHPYADHVEEKIVTCGFASIGYYCADIDPETGYANSILSIFPEDKEPDACRTIGAWSMGALTAMDYMACHDGFDLGKCAVVGCSRYGKTALWTGINEPRYQLIGLIESGHGGAAMARVTDGEKAANLSGAFHWTCENYASFAGKDDALPYDAHMLLSLIAPRYLYITSANDDYWCDPEAELLSAKMAGKVYELYGLKGLSDHYSNATQKPDLAGTIGYHCRNGSHGFSNYDWQCFLAFAMRKFGIADE